MNYIKRRLTAVIFFFDCNLIIPTPVFWKELARLTSAVQSVREAKDERNARLQEICAQQDSSLQYTEVC